MILPDDDDLKPLYDAAIAYGKASVESMRIYSQSIDELGDHKLAARTPEVRSSQAESRRLYKITDAARTAVNEKFPGLNLPCPAPHVGWTGEIESYRDSVRSAIESYLGRQWADANDGELAAVRKTIVSLPVVQRCDLNVNDLVYSTTINSIFKVVKVSPKRTKVEANNLVTGESVRLGHSFREGEGYKRINQPLCDRLMALYQSRKLAVKDAVQRLAT